MKSLILFLLLILTNEIHSGGPRSEGKNILQKGPKISNQEPKKPDISDSNLDNIKIIERDWNHLDTFKVFYEPNSKFV